MLTTRTSLTALAAAALLSMAACGTSQPSEAQTAKDEATTGGPITLTDGAGRTVELPAPAENVVVLEWQQIEDVLTLGVEPVGVADAEGYRTWDSAEELSDDVVDVGLRGEPNMDAVFKTDPDLIITEVYGPADALVKRFEKYDVPVLATLGADAKDPIGQMKETFTLIAKALGKEDQAADVLDEFDTSVADAKAEIADLGLDNNRFAYADAYLNGSTVAIRPFGQGSFVGELGEAIGLENVWKGKVDPAYGLGQTDLEGITDIGDARLFYTGTEAETWFSEVEDNPVWKNAEFVKNGDVAAFQEGIWTFGGPRSGQQIVEAFVDAVA